MPNDGTLRNNELYDAAEAKDWQACCRLSAEKFDFALEGCEQLERNVRKIIAFTRKKGSLLCKLIIGETGTGKGKLARLIHEMSLPDQNFVHLNMAGMSPDLVNNELFGHGKGAFTGAEGEKKGKLEIAGKGTVFLDEIGDAHLTTQMNLLGATGNGRAYYPVGDTKELVNEAQIVSATNADLQAGVFEKRIRTDFLYRIAGVVLSIPNWKDREEAHKVTVIKTLVSKFAKKFQEPEIVIEPDAIDCLLELPMNGNLREVEDLIERAIYLALDNDSKHIQITNILEAKEFGFAFGIEALKINGIVTRDSSSGQSITPRSTLDENERRYILETFEKTGWNKTLTAKLLGIEHSTLSRKMHGWKTVSDSDIEQIVTLDKLEEQYIKVALIENKWNQTHTAELLGIARGTLITKIRKYGIQEPVNAT